MAHQRMVDSYLRDLLEDADGLTPTDDGGYRLAGEPPVHLLVCGSGPALRVLASAVVAEDVPATPQVCEQVNEVNAGLPYGRLFAHDGQIVAEESIHGSSLSATLLDHALLFVRWAANTHAATFTAETAGPGDGASPAEVHLGEDGPAGERGTVAAPPSTVADADAAGVATQARPLTSAAGYL